jgi:hypothetical protein
MGLPAGLDILEKTKISCFYQELKIKVTMTGKLNLESMC